jgi:glycosyltransferase 2 family protein
MAEREITIGAETLAPWARTDRPTGRLRRLLPLAVLAIVLLLVGRQAKTIDWHETWAQLRQTSLAWLIAAGFIYYAGFLARCLRWRRLLANAGYDRERLPAMPGLFGLAGIMYRAWSMNAVTIAQLGDGYRAFSFKRRTGAAGAPVLGTILAERVVDAVVLAGLLIPTVAIAFRRHLSTDAVWALIVAGSVAAAGPVFLRFLPAIVRIASRFAPAKIAAPLTELSGGVSKSLGRIRLIVLFSAFGWLGECAMLYFVARAAGTPISPAAAGTVALITALLPTIPLPPGGLGVAEAGIVLMLGQLGVSPGPAAAIAVLARAISFGSVILGGGVSWLLAAQSDDQPAPTLDPIRDAFAD